MTAVGNLGLEKNQKFVEIEIAPALLSHGCMQHINADYHTLT